MDRLSGSTDPPEIIALGLEPPFHLLTWPHGPRTVLSDEGVPAGNVGDVMAWRYGGKEGTTVAIILGDRPPESEWQSCVQGSGTLKQGGTVSFAKRDCECADVCPRTGQRICSDLLDAAKFPWGRGATGKSITPLLSVAVDTNVIPLGTGVYVPEYNGMPRDTDQTSFHDGCFMPHDRGLKVVGKQIDVFTGHQSVTKLWNKLVSSNQGVPVILDSPRCAVLTRAAEGDKGAAE